MNYFNQSKFKLVFIILLGIILFMTGQKTRNLWGTSEARTAQIAQEMIDSGDWVIPHLNNQPRLTKPPLYFWAVALTAKLLCNNHVTEWSARFPASVCAVLTLIFLFLMVKKLYGEKTAFSSSIMLATTYFFFWQSQEAMLDMMLAMFEVAACLFFVYGLKAQVHRKKFFYIPMHFCLGLAAMTKGPVGFIIPWIGIVAYLLWSSKIKELKHFCWITGFIVFSITVTPWLIAVYHRIDTAFSVFYKETVSRYASAYDHQRPLYYFIVRFPLYFLPWGIFLPFWVWDIYKNKTLNEYKFPISFFLPALIFFSLCGSKRSYYLVPLYPFVIISLALFLSKCSCVKIFGKKIILLKQSYLYTLVFISSLGYLIFISLFPVLNKRFSAVDFCERLTNELPEKYTLMSYDYSKPYIIYYLKQYIHPIKSEEELNSKLSDISAGSPLFVIMREKDLLRMKNVSDKSYNIIFRYKNFTKKHNTMVVITGRNSGGKV
ncbi:glycosyltransferase family 39 protein [bacterium]|nr:glycosyltransferase family 39 protein [bacterium]